MAYIKSQPLLNSDKKETWVDISYWRFSRDEYTKDNIAKCVRCWMDGYLNKEAYQNGKWSLSRLFISISYQALGITDPMNIKDIELIPKLYQVAKNEIFIEKTVKKPVPKEVTVKVIINQQDENGDWTEVITDEIKTQYWWSVEAFDNWRTHNPDVHAQPFVFTQTVEEDVTEKEFLFSDAEDDL